MSFENWALFVAVAVLPVLSPGPAVLLAISNAVRFGPGAVLWSAAANSLGLTILGTAVTVGLGALVAASAYAFLAVKVAGAIYLCWLGVTLWRSGKALDFTAESGTRAKTRRALFGEALALALMNPKALVLLAALLPPFIDHAGPVLPQAAVLSVTFAVMCFVNHLLLAAASGKARRFLASPLRIRTLRRSLGALFIGSGAALALGSR